MYSAAHLQTVHFIQIVGRKSKLNSDMFDNCLGSNAVLVCLLVYFFLHGYFWILFLENLLILCPQLIQN